MFIIVFYGLYSVLNAVNRTAEYVCLILRGMKMVYGAVSANKQAATAFWMYIFNVLCMMNSIFSTGSRPNGKHWQDFPKAAPRYRHQEEIELCAGGRGGGSCHVFVHPSLWAPAKWTEWRKSRDSQNVWQERPNVFFSASCIQLWWWRWVGPLKRCGVGTVGHMSDLSLARWKADGPPRTAGQIDVITRARCSDTHSSKRYVAGNNKGKQVTSEGFPPDRSTAPSITLSTIGNIRLRCLLLKRLLRVHN